MSERYWEVGFNLGGGWRITGRLLADTWNAAADNARASVIEILHIDPGCAEVVELDILTGARK